MHEPCPSMDLQSAMRQVHMRNFPMDTQMPFSNLRPSDIQSFAAMSQQQQNPIPESMNPFGYSEAGQYTSGPVSLFPPPGINVQQPFPSPGAAMFPPTFVQPFSTASGQPQPPSSMHMSLSSKPSDILNSSSVNNLLSYPSVPCGAAFTSSSHNMALTAAIAAPSPAPHDVPEPSPEPIMSSMAANNNKLDQPLQRLSQAMQSEKQPSSLQQSNEPTPSQTLTYQPDPDSPPTQQPTPHTHYGSRSISSASTVATPRESPQLVDGNGSGDLLANAEMKTPDASVEVTSKRPTRYNAQQAAQNITQQLRAK